MAFPTISHSSLVSSVFYDRATGFFHRRTNQRRRIFDPPNTGPRFSERWSHDGYTYIHLYWLKPNEVRADLLAWFCETGDWPQGEIEYIDGNKNNNAFENLRLIPYFEKPIKPKKEIVTPKEERKPKGIKKTKNGKFQAFVFKWRCSFYLGLFDTEQEAFEACKIAKKAKTPDEIILKRQRDRITPAEERLPKKRKRKNEGGPRGIMKQRNGTYHARIKIDGTYISLGSYRREEEALSVYRRAKARAQYVKEEKRQKFLSDTEKLKKMLLEQQD